QANVTEATPKTNYISKAKAKQLALKKVSGKIVEVEFDRDDRTPHYEIEIKNSKEEVELEVDAVSGKVKITDRDPIKKKTTKKKTKLITKQKAIAIAKSKVNGKPIVTDIDLENGGGVRYYDIELKLGNKEYDVEVNAVTGKVIKFERD
ncbi:MAG: PepSY domain-containing protein, partial [Lysinibacillus sp.]